MSNAGNTNQKAVRLSIRFLVPLEFSLVYFAILKDMDFFRGWVRLDLAQPHLYSGEDRLRFRDIYL